MPLTALMPLVAFHELENVVKRLKYRHYELRTKLRMTFFSEFQANVEGERPDGFVGILPQPPPNQK